VDEPRKMMPRPRLVALGVVGLGLCLAGPLLALPILHEYFEPDPAEDLRLGATTPNGDLPAALDTPSGVVGAPPETAADPRRAVTYGGNKTPSSVDASYRIDRLTTAPARVPYDEPFRPSVLPFKRLHAFDEVRADLTLGVHDGALRRVMASGSVQTGEAAFFGDYELDLQQDQAVRVPTVGAGTRLISLSTKPTVSLELVSDGAENWFARSERTERVHVVVQLALAERALVAGFADKTFADLHPQLVPLPDEARAAAARVTSALGLTPNEAPAAVLDKLVAHFRSFEASAELPTATNTAELYVELALTKKGVCRHRAYAFLLTALALGLPTRLVHNEAHAWVEVHDGSVWHRLDLGGAPSDIEETRPPADVPLYRAPADPFAWPQGSQSGSSLAARSQPQTHSTSWPSALSPTGRAPSKPPSGTPRVPGLPSDPSLHVTLQLERAQLRRGALLGVRGHAARGDHACEASRIDLELVTPLGVRPLGSVATDSNGDFDGHVLLPLDVPAGDQTVVAKVGSGCR